MSSPVHVVGAGLIGTSLGLALSRQGVEVSLQDPSPTAVALAADLGAGVARDPRDPAVVVVAAPPDVAASVVLDALTRWPSAVVTDVASVKSTVLAQVRASAGVGDLRRYVGSHPMAGRERSGAVAAQADLFEGRTWVVCPHESTDAAVADRVRELARRTGAAVVTMGADDHDRAVAYVSHLPQVAASLVAGRLRDLPDAAVALAGQGIRDVTRIAASDPLLWTQILAGNAEVLAPVLREVAQELEAVAGALAAIAAREGDGARGVVARTIGDGQLGHARIPGKHGAAPTSYATIVVLVPDEPGALGRLFQDVGDAGVNLEDLRLEHGVGAPLGIAELSVLPSAVDRLMTQLRAKDWKVHE